MTARDRILLWVALCMSAAALFLAAYGVHQGRAYRAELRRLGEALARPAAPDASRQLAPPLPQLDPDPR